MKEFSYIAAKKDGTEVKGKKKASEKSEIVQYLHENNLSVISIQESLGFNLSAINEIQIGGIPLKDRMLITKQMATMISAGVPLIQALEVLVSQAQNKKMKRDLESVYSFVKGGMPLSKAFQRSSDIYDELQVSLIEAGEKSGNLVEIFQQISIDLEKRNKLTAKIRGAMIYPIIIFIVIIVVIFVMTFFMVPAIEGLYEDFGVTTDALPLPTKIMVMVSGFLTNPIGVVVLLFTILATVVGIRGYYSSESGRRVIDKMLLKTPVFGQIIDYAQVVQLTRLLSMLLKSGLSIIDALNTVSKSLGNVHYKEAVNKAVLDVSKGGALSVSFSKSEIIPFILTKMIAIGEETGSLDKMLSDMAAFYEEELNSLTENLTKLMEPIILLIVGGIVAVLALAIYLPIYSISQF
ncbi:MAG TPA: type II secretion system F family protein [Candidatus Dojkabacteria bacterium]|jgi:type IV pilus assembly protein PilC